jgi:hypothetical protein
MRDLLIFSVGAQKMIFQNMVPWYADYFKLKALGDQHMLDEDFFSNSLIFLRINSTKDEHNCLLSSF